MLWVEMSYYKFNENYDLFYQYEDNDNIEQYFYENEKEE